MSFQRRKKAESALPRKNAMSSDLGRASVPKLRPTNAMDHCPWKTQPGLQSELGTRKGPAPQHELEITHSTDRAHQPTFHPIN